MRHLFAFLLAVFTLAAVVPAHAAPTVPVAGALKFYLLKSFTSQANDAAPNTDGLTPTTAGSTHATSRILSIGVGSQYPRAIGWYYTGHASESCTITPWQWDPTGLVWVSAAARAGAARYELDVLADLSAGYIFLQMVCTGSFSSPEKLYAGFVEGASNVPAR